jgi:hypothetical protein
MEECKLHSLALLIVVCITGTRLQDMIRTSLLKMPTRDLETQATQCFRNVTAFMGDRNSGKDDTGHADKVRIGYCHRY